MRLLEKWLCLRAAVAKQDNKAHKKRIGTLISAIS
jgi:hypothetical protein